MNDPATESDAEASRPWHEKEYQDPHYHDEEPELAQDQGGRPRWPGKRRTNRPRLPKRRYED